MKRERTGENVTVETLEMFEAHSAPVDSTALDDVLHLRVGIVVSEVHVVVQEGDECASITLNESQQRALHAWLSSNLARQVPVASGA